MECHTQSYRGTVLRGVYLPKNLSDVTPSTWGLGQKSHIVIQGLYIYTGGDVR